MLPLKQEIVYGPVNSRRLGRSLGINLLPADRKVCSFDCVYCQYGRTAGATLHPDPEGFPPLDAVIAAVEGALASGLEAGIERVPPERLRQIAARVGTETGLDARAYWPASR